MEAQIITRPGPAAVLHDGPAAVDKTRAILQSDSSVNPPNDNLSNDYRIGAHVLVYNRELWAGLTPSQMILGVMFIPLVLVAYLGDPLVVAVTLSMIMASHDLFDRTIPNRLNLSAASLGMLIAWQTGGLPALGNSFLVACGALVALVVLYLFGFLGAGDVKALAALATFASGWQDAFVMLLLVTLFGGVQALIVALWEKWRQFTQQQLDKNRLLSEITGLAASSSMMLKWCMKTWGGRPASPLGLKTQLPYGVAIFGGTLIWAMIRGWS
ncbi:A24 family peptidase [Desulfoferula mesophila]|uniref:Prepilin type IV endopeptidase peptidase domain-containing protein n=1 Tax=Desulfoferula mesophila TaxID=3058419 RepID=A0AAU9EY16_9BACT|nr:hypothetical protein FAK_07330 [Desulfoferula mesophilus]